MKRSYFAGETRTATMKTIKNLSGPFHHTEVYKLLEVTNKKEQKAIYFHIHQLFKQGALERAGKGEYRKTAFFSTLDEGSIQAPSTVENKEVSFIDIGRGMVELLNNARKKVEELETELIEAWDEHKKCHAQVLDLENQMVTKERIINDQKETIAKLNSPFTTKSGITVKELVRGN